ncbi:MAG: metal ABC transporter permease, partial [Syntrophaceae bacterium]
WKEFKLLCFDPDFARSLGFPIRWLDVLLITLLVTSIVIGLQTVGVVLMSAMVVAPAAAARQWTDRLGAMVAISALFGGLAGGAGALTSSVTERLPTGPTIVLCLTAIVLVSLLAAPNRGVLWRWARERANRNILQTEAVLADLFVLARRHDDPGHGHPISVLRTMSIGHGGVDRSLEVLRERGLVRKTGDGTWSLTPRGLDEAKRLAGSRGEEP